MTKKTSTKKRIFYFIAPLSIAYFLFLLIDFTNIKTQNQIEDFLPKSHPLIENQRSILSQYAVEKNDNLWVINLKSKSSWLEPEKLKSLEQFTKELESLFPLRVTQDLSRYQLSLADKDSFNFKELSQVVVTPEIQETLIESSLSSPSLLSKDLNETRVYFEVTSPEANSKEWASKLKLHLDQRLGKDAYTLLSSELTQNEIALSLGRETVLFFGLSLLILVLLSALLYKSFWISYYSLTNFVSSFLLCLALTSYFGIAHNSLSVSIPVLILIIQISLYSHLLPSISSTNAQSFFAVLRENAFAISMSLITSWIGFISLSFSDSLAINHYSYAAALAIFCTGFCSLGSLFLLQAVASNSLPNSESANSSRGFLRWLLKGNFLNSSRMQKLFLTFGSFAIVGGSFCLFQSDFDKRSASLLPKSSNYLNQLEYFRKKVSGDSQLELHLDAGSPDFWIQEANIQKLDAYLKSWKKSSSQVLSITSYLDYFRALSPQGALPSSTESASELIFLMELTGLDSLKNYKNTDNSSLRIQFALETAIASEQNKIADKVSQDLQTLFPSAQIKLTGNAVIHPQLKEAVSKSLVYGFYFSMAVISLLLCFLWKSPTQALVALIPNLVPVSLVLIFLKLSGWGIDPSTAIAFSIALGLSFDSTIFFMQKFQKKTSYLLLPTHWYKKAPDIAISSLCMLLSFSAFYFSSIEVNLRFASLMIVSSFSAFLADAYLLPSILILIYGKKQKTSSLSPTSPIPYKEESSQTPLHPDLAMEDAA